MKNEIMKNEIMEKIETYKKEYQPYLKWTLSLITDKENTIHYVLMGQAYADVVVNDIIKSEATTTSTLVDKWNDSVNLVRCINRSL